MKAEKNNIFTSLYYLQLTEGCISFGCHHPQCKSCPNFIYSTETDEFLHKTADVFAKNHQHENFLCPNFPPTLYDFAIFENVLIFNDFLSDYIHNHAIQNETKIIEVFSNLHNFPFLFSYDLNEIDFYSIHPPAELIQDFILSEKSNPEFLRFLQQPLFDIVKKIISDDDYIQSHIDSLYHLRAIYISFLFYRLFSENQFLLLDLINHVMTLLPAAHLLLSEMISKTSIFIDELNSAIQNALTQYITAKKVQFDETLWNAAKFIHFILVPANNKSDNPIPYKSFANKNLSKTFIATRELIRFISSRPTFLFTPSVINMIKKSKLLPKGNILTSSSHFKLTEVNSSFKIEDFAGKKHIELLKCNNEEEEEEEEEYLLEEEEEEEAYIEEDTENSETSSDSEEDDDEEEDNNNDNDNYNNNTSNNNRNSNSNTRLNNHTNSSSNSNTNRQNRLNINSRRNTNSDIIFADIDSYIRNRPPHAIDINVDLDTSLFSDLISNSDSDSNSSYRRRYGVLKIKVRRDHLLDDTLVALLTADQKELMGKVRVQFQGEEAYDAGGVSREFFSLVTSTLFSPDYGMFELVNERFYWFRSSESNEQARYFTLLGAFIGIAINNKVILPIRFPLLMYKKLLNYKNSKFDINDLAEIDPSIAQSLKSLLESKEKGENIEESGLMFDFSYEYFDTIQTKELIENGSNIPVTNDNIDLYIEKVIDWKLNKSIENQFIAFKKGYDMNCNTPIMKIFAPVELDELVSGIEKLDWEAFKKSVTYRGYNKTSQTIKDLWQIIDHEWDDTQRTDFLYFITGTKTAPVGGLGQLKITIEKVRNTNQLPKTHTCFNELSLPDYKNIDLMRKKLQICLENCEGFGLV